MPIYVPQSDISPNILAKYKLTGRIYKDVKIILGEREQIDTKEKALAILEYSKQAKTKKANFFISVPFTSYETMNLLSHIVFKCQLK